MQLHGYLWSCPEDFWPTFRLLGLRLSWTINSAGWQRRMYFGIMTCEVSLRVNFNGVTFTLPFLWLTTIPRWTTK